MDKFSALPPTNFNPALPPRESELAITGPGSVSMRQGIPLINTQAKTPQPNISQPNTDISNMDTSRQNTPINPASVVFDNVPNQNLNRAQILADAGIKPDSAIGQAFLGPYPIENILKHSLVGGLTEKPGHTSSIVPDGNPRAALRDLNALFKQLPSDTPGLKEASELLTKKSAEIARENRQGYLKDAGIKPDSAIGQAFLGPYPIENILKHSLVGGLTEKPGYTSSIVPDGNLNAALRDLDALFKQLPSDTPGLREASELLATKLK